MKQPIMSVGLPLLMLLGAGCATTGTGFGAAPVAAGPGEIQLNAVKCRVRAYDCHPASREHLVEPAPSDDRRYDHR
jgi:hypothetical protein